MKNRLLLTIVAVLALFATASAQIPKTISYQGVLAASDGTLVPNGNHNLTISLYESPSGGSAVYTENHTVAIVNGIFNAIIGSITTLPASVKFDRAYYMGVSVDGGAELTPRTPMTAAPYAMNALHADVADALSPSATGVVSSINGQSGQIILQGGGGTTISNVGNTFTVSSSGGGGGNGIQGVQNTDGSLTITSPNGPVATLSVAAAGITNSKLAADAVTSTNILDGTIATEDLSAGAVTNTKIGSGAATTGQVLSANGSGGTAWTTPNEFTLPYANTLTNAGDLFSVTNAGTGGAGFFKNTNTAATKSALYGEVNITSPSTLVAGIEGKSTNGFGVIGHGGASSSGIYGAVITTPTAGAFYAGTGVSGFSDAGHGVGGVTYSATSSGVYGSATGNGTGVRGTSTTGKAGLFEITNNANTNNALTGTSSGTGAGSYGGNTATTGSTTGVMGEAASTANGTGANGGVSGVVGRVTPTSPGGYSAGVRGLNNGTGGTGIGVIGYQAGSGWGVYGETPSGFGVYGLTTNASAASSGVRGETFSTNGIGVEAKYSGSGLGVALEVDNGAIRVAGTNKAAFVHTATVANKLSANGTDVDNVMCNGDPNCFLIVTQKLNPTGIVYNNSPIGVYYNTTRNKWEIFNENNAAIPTNAQFNVLVIKQ